MVSIACPDASWQGSWEHSVLRGATGQQIEVVETFDGIPYIVVQLGWGQASTVCEFGTNIVDGARSTAQLPDRARGFVERDRLGGVRVVDDHLIEHIANDNPGSMAGFIQIGNHETALLSYGWAIRPYASNPKRIDPWQFMEARAKTDPPAAP